MSDVVSKAVKNADTVALDEENNALVIIDQTKLPGKLELLSLTGQEDIFQAIYLLKVRGAPAIGVAAAIGLYLAAREIETDDREDFYRELKKAKEYLASSRPTAVNLFWALNRMEACALAHRELSVEEIKETLREEALRIREEDILVCRAIGEHGLSLLRDGAGILTHCNAGRLATVQYGTALAAVHLGRERGMNFRVYTDETRPLLQGARLSAFEMAAAGVDTTVICDNMASQVMKNGWVDIVFVGADRVAANGDAANKIGTLGVATLAHAYNIPFYVACPVSTIDPGTPTGAGIPIEERDADEVRSLYGTPTAPPAVKVYNPAFDVTPAGLIAGVVTEKGVLRPPYDKAIKELFS